MEMATSTMGDQTIGKVLLHGYRCRCGHEWLARDKDREPRVCPKCKSPNWDRARQWQRTA
jgi:predicted Zn-ribbon and HTH transcriptional regulator